MRIVLGLGCALGLLAGCQSTTQSARTPTVGAPLETVGQPLAAEELRGQPSERRAKINACLIEMGLPPMAEGLGAGTAPMAPEDARTFSACMARAS